MIDDGDHDCVKQGGPVADNDDNSFDNHDDDSFYDNHDDDNFYDNHDHDDDDCYDNDDEISQGGPAAADSKVARRKMTGLSNKVVLHSLHHHQHQH